MLKKIFTLAVLITASVFYCSEGVAQSKAAKIASLLNEYNKQGQFDGTALVVEKNKVTYRMGFGFANREWRIRNTADTRFRIGSITKQFTSMMIFQLVQEGKLKLEDKIGVCLADYPKNSGSKVSIYNLLNHTSGIPDWDNDSFWPDKARSRYASEYFVKTFLSNDLAFEPGSKFSYSNGDYYLLGLLIEKVTGKSWEENLRQRILIPLGMKNTGVDIYSEVIPMRATGYVKEKDKFVIEPYVDLTNYFSAGAMYSTVDDLLLWLRSFDNEKMLQKKYRDVMLKGNPEFGYAASGSWVYKKAFGKKEITLIERGGIVKGFRSHAIRTADGNVIILLSNNESENIYGIAQNILNLLYGQPVNMPK
jgi:CubicO group peptidase (beta-lactamase class C family)